MTFIIRTPGHNVQFMKIAASPSVTRPVDTGRLVYITGDREVDFVSNASGQTAIGWSLQKVKDEYTDFPTGFRLQGDLGSSDCFVGDPIAIACGPGAIYETDQYVDEGSDGIAAGTLLYCDDDGKLSDTNADSASAAAAIALNTLTATQCTDEEMLLIKALI